MQDEKPIDTLPTVEELIVEQARHNCCKLAILNVGKSGSKVSFHQCGHLGGQSIGDTSIQIVSQTSLRARILYLTYHPSMAGHPGQRCMNAMSSQIYHWSHMASNVYTIIAKCESCVQIRKSIMPQKTTTSLLSIWTTRLFLATDALELLP